MRGQLSFFLANHHVISTSDSYPRRTVFFPGKESLGPNSPTYAWPTVFFPSQPSCHFDFRFLSEADCLFPWQKILSLQILRLMWGQRSFLLAENHIVPNSPTYAWPTVFFPSQPSCHFDFRFLSEAKCLFLRVQVSIVSTFRLIRCELSFSLAKNIIAPNSPTYVRPAVFFTGQPSCRFDFRFLSETNRLFSSCKESYRS